MLEIDIVADTDLSEWAIKVVRDFFEKNPPEMFQKKDKGYLTEKDWPVSRAQVNGLRQLAGREPTRVKEFADKQAEKDKKSLRDIENQLKDIKKKLERRPYDEDLLKKEEKLEQQKKQLQGRLDFWTEVKKAADCLKQRYQGSSDLYMVFFQRFCAHYLYEMARRTQSEKDDEGD